MRRGNSSLALSLPILPLAENLTRHLGFFASLIGLVRSTLGKKKKRTDGLGVGVLRRPFSPDDDFVL